MSGSLDHSPADVIRYLLISLGLGTLPEDGAAWPIYCDQEPDRPDNCLTIYNTAGRDNGRVMINGERQEHHGFQVRIRAVTPVVGYPKARAIAVAMDQDVNRDSITIGYSEYLIHSISRTTDVFSLGEEVPASKRKIYTVNAVATLEQTN